MLTRNHVKDDPSLKGAYMAIEHEYLQSGSVDKIRGMAEKLQEKLGFDGKRSIIAEVSIQCMESFAVFDAESGSLIQGNEAEEEQIAHVIRFEMVTSKGAKGERMLGSWQIIDWDDMLNGNCWH